MQVVLLRHAQSEANAGDFINDDPRRPVGLTAVGREQARRAGEALRDFGFSHAWSSEFPRARETAARVLAGQHCPLAIDPRLNERRSGLDGLPTATFNDLVRPDPVRIAPPQGESFLEVMARVSAFFGDLQTLPEDARVLVVSHENPIQAMLAVAGLDPDTALREGIGNATWRILVNPWPGSTLDAVPAGARA
jgi:broad specificity phosphatase PhoE